MTRYFCEYWDVTPPEYMSCESPATRHIYVMKGVGTDNPRPTEEYFLCHQHTLNWLTVGGRRTQHIIQSLAYPIAGVASWIDYSTKEHFDGSEPPIGRPIHVEWDGNLNRCTKDHTTEEGPCTYE
jgi:hypothetical protein